MGITIRDLFSGTPISNPTLRELAEEHPEHTLYEQSGQNVAAMVPGEGVAEAHPEYPKEFVENLRCQLARVKARADERISHIHEEHLPVPAPEFDEEAFHPPIGEPNPHYNGRRADVWPWPKKE